MAEQKNIGTTYKNFPVPNNLLAEIESYLVHNKSGKKSDFYARCLKIGFDTIKINATKSSNT